MRRDGGRILVSAVFCAMLCVAPAAQAESASDEIHGELASHTGTATWTESSDEFQPRRKGGRKEPVDINGFYQGSFFLKKIKAHSAPDCTATTQIDSLFLVQSQGKKVSITFGPEDVPWTGRRKRKSFKASETQRDGILTRKMIISGKKVTGETAKFLFKEVVSSGGAKLCTFIHTGTFLRR